MNPQEEGVNREKQVVIDYAERIDKILIQNGIAYISDSAAQNGVAFEVGNPGEKPSLVVLQRIKPEQLPQDWDDKELPLDIPYVGVTQRMRNKQNGITLSTDYYLNLAGDSGVTRLILGEPKSDVADESKSPISPKLEDLKAGDFENIEWLLQNIESGNAELRL